MTHIDLHSGDGCEEGDSRAGGGARPEGGIACENGSWSGGGSDHGTELEACSRVASDNDRVAAWYVRVNSRDGDTRRIYAPVWQIP